MPAVPDWARQPTWPPTPSDIPARRAGARPLVIVLSIIGGFFAVSVLAAVAIPVTINQRLKAQLAQVRALTCDEVATNAVALSQAGVKGDEIPLSAVTNTTLAADERAGLRVPEQGAQTFAFTCTGEGTWADGIETPVTVDVYIDDQAKPLLAIGWDE